MKKAELEDRVIALEGIVQEYADLIQHFVDACPFSSSPIQKLENVSMALYNAAEVRVGIEELVNFEVKYASDEGAEDET